MAIEMTYYPIVPEGKLQCMKCGVPLVKGKAKFMYLDNGFPVELPVCPVCGFVYVPEALAVAHVASVERALEDQCTDHPGGPPIPGIFLISHPCQPGHAFWISVQVRESLCC